MKKFILGLGTLASAVAPVAAVVACGTTKDGSLTFTGAEMQKALEILEPVLGFDISSLGLSESEMSDTFKLKVSKIDKTHIEFTLTNIAQASVSVKTNELVAKKSQTKSLNLQPGTTLKASMVVSEDGSTFESTLFTLNDEEYVITPSSTKLTPMSCSKMAKRMYATFVDAPAISTTITLSDEVQTKVFAELKKHGNSVERIFGDKGTIDMHGKSADIKDTSEVIASLSALTGKLDLQFNLIAGGNGLLINSNSGGARRFSLAYDQVAKMHLVGTLIQTATGVEVETTLRTATFEGQSFDLSTIGANVLSTVIANALPQFKKDAPANQQPANQQPANQQPANQQPANQQPANQQPANQQPPVVVHHGPNPVVLTATQKTILDGFYTTTGATISSSKPSTSGQYVNVDTSTNITIGANGSLSYAITRTNAKTNENIVFSTLTKSGNHLTLAEGETLTVNLGMDANHHVTSQTFTLSNSQTSSKNGQYTFASTDRTALTRYVLFAHKVLTVAYISPVATAAHPTPIINNLLAHLSDSSWGSFMKWTGETTDSIPLNGLQVGIAFTWSTNRVELTVKGTLSKEVIVDGGTKTYAAGSIIEMVFDCEIGSDFAPLDKVFSVTNVIAKIKPSSGNPEYRIDDPTVRFQKSVAQIFKDLTWG